MSIALKIIGFQSIVKNYLNPIIFASYFIILYGLVLVSIYLSIYLFQGLFKTAVVAASNCLQISVLQWLLELELRLWHTYGTHVLVCRELYFFFGSGKILNITYPRIISKNLIALSQHDFNIFLLYLYKRFYS